MSHSTRLFMGNSGAIDLDLMILTSKPATKIALYHGRSSGAAGRPPALAADAEEDLVEEGAAGCDGIMYHLLKHL